ncbi:hypothetical protein FACS189434_03610 [Bacteroidia bacterium]|nr:hypothetical protein FACS189434_03610 [Bacteroidia bacterium]
MGWRFRKTKRFGIFRTTLSKKGIGTSVGIPGLRFGISPDGRKYFSMGFPGTGLYYIKYFKENKKAVKSTTPEPKPKQIKIYKVNSITDKF